MRAKRVDTNHKEIVRALRQSGAFVQSMANIGRGCPDLLVGFRGKWFALEVKQGKAKLTDDEYCWHKLASLHAPVHIVRSSVEAIQVLFG